jgi:hypothetical protein
MNYSAATARPGVDTVRIRGTSAGSGGKPVMKRSSALGLILRRPQTKALGSRPCSMARMIVRRPRPAAIVASSIVIAIFAGHGLLKDMGFSV